MGDRNLDGAKSFVRDVALRVGKPGRVLWVNPSGGPGGDITGANASAFGSTPDKLSCRFVDFA
jgi:hypothetical protein